MTLDHLTKNKSSSPASPQPESEYTWRDSDPAESQRLYALVKERWGFTGYWHPIKKEAPQPADVISVRLGHQHSPGVMIIPDRESQEVKQLEQRVIALLKEKGYKRIFCLNYDGKPDENAEWDVDDFCFEFNQEEVWCPAGAEWLIYSSHEHTLAFGASWLVEAVAPFLPQMGRVVKS